MRDEPQRVVVTGAGNITALGDNWADFKAALVRGTSAVVPMQNWREVAGLHCTLAAPVDFTMPDGAREL